MKASDYIVEFLIRNNVKDVFGYPGGMVTHLMDSLGKRSNEISVHITYHEQAAAFAACGYAQASGKVGVAFATSGPGATNLLTGIGHAYYDSVPSLFITGQVNTFESKGMSAIRQRGFQETDIALMAKPITKGTFYVSCVSQLMDVLDKAFVLAQEDRKGPVLIDIPMDIFRADVDNNANEIIIESKKKSQELERFEKTLKEHLLKAQRPCLLLGNGIKICNQIDNIRGILRSCPMPVVSSMLAVDVIPESQGLEGIYYGFVGAYGNRTANFTVAKCDLLICLGSRLDVRQVGGKRENFAPGATILRVDIDDAELENKIREDEKQFMLDVSDAVSILRQCLMECKPYEEWLSVCREIKKQIKYIDEREPNRYINEISKIVPDEYGITVDVGQNMVWTAQSFKLKPRQRMHFSGGMGAMGYALPAAIGVYYATGKPVICIAGDGGLQMNIQELQYLVRENIPVKVFVINNLSLGMIRHFQEMYFDSRYYYTIEQEGYNTPDFVKVATAYGIEAKEINSVYDIANIRFNSSPELYEIKLRSDTIVSPKLEFGKPNQDQEPLLDRELYNYLMEL